MYVFCVLNFNTIEIKNPAVCVDVMKSNTALLTRICFKLDKGLSVVRINMAICLLLFGDNNKIEWK